MPAGEEIMVGKRTQSLRRALGDACLIVLIGMVVALVANFLRADGLPLVARTPYSTLVPCPEPGGPVESLDAGSPEVASGKSCLVDARSQSEFDTQHLPGALNVHYDWLDPLPEETLAELARSIAASGAMRVVVYGDGGRPDSGEYLAKEISGRGIKNVHFIRGGASAALGRETP
jgi:hypothetical protein